ncbi:MAG TPA: bifunctional (p)ppGpp synthetase/guanosine-3',5'-bis(diphosphate) 3'-pyrophosphohydrolase, partial [Arthrobacter sp.]|nr:bifunctional (p)ppGpp synthetase/guanosine-3',5'-bis(diphosphate) 3'-pyrophosphohydrolase [Arthrobacter sp.]
MTPARPAPSDPAETEKRAGVAERSDGTSGTAAESRPTFPGRRERTRARIARLTGRGPSGYSPILEPLLRTVRANNPKEDFDLI